MAAQNDAELVAESLAGNREAFGQVVARYQSLVCALAYSATGSLSRSEDLAQDTFITAWQQLPKLREPAKLRPWLCGIARCLIGNALRREGREPVGGAESLDSVPEPASREPLPPERVISQEEEGILWRSLEKIPELYREPLVLYYREHHSVESVAQTLELTEDAVKQRLSRGRKLLHEHVLAFVEGALEHTAPSTAFTLGVLGALPLVATPAHAAVIGTVAATAKGSGAAKGAGILAGIGFAAAALGAAVGGIFAIRGRIRSARSDRERRFLARSSWGFLGWIILLQITLQVGISVRGGVIINNLRDALGWSLVWIGLFGVWVAYSIWMVRRQIRIQIEDGTFTGIPSRMFPGSDSARPGFRARVYGGLAAMVFGPGGMLIAVVSLTGDRLTAGLLAVLAVAAWTAGARAIMRRPEKTKAIFVTIWWGLGLVTLATFNLRFHAWARNPEYLWPRNPHAFHPAPLSLNFIILAFYVSIGLAWWLERHFAATRRVRRDATVAVSIFVALFALGLILFHLGA